MLSGKFGEPDKFEHASQIDTGLLVKNTAMT